MIQTKADLDKYYGSHGGYSIANAKKVQALNATELAAKRNPTAAAPASVAKSPPSKDRRLRKLASKIRKRGRIGTAY